MRTKQNFTISEKMSYFSIPVFGFKVTSRINLCIFKINTFKIEFLQSEPSSETIETYSLF